MLVARFCGLVCFAFLGMVITLRCNILIVVIQEQMDERLEQQRLAHLEHARERGEVDEVMAAIEDEDRQQAALKQQKAIETMQYVREILSEREQRLDYERRSDEAEERKIQVLSHSLPFVIHSASRSIASPAQTS